MIALSAIIGSLIALVWNPFSRSNEYVAGGITTAITIGLAYAVLYYMDNRHDKTI